MISFLFRSAAQKAVQTLQLKPISIFQKLSFHNRYGGTFQLKDFIYENTHDSAGSLKTRFVKYLALESCKYDPLTPQKIKYSEFYPIHDPRSFSQVLKETPTDQLPRLLVFTFTYKTNGDQMKFVQALNEIDAVCVKRLKDMDTDTIVRTLYSLMFLIPNQICKTQFYKQSVAELVNRNDKVLNKNEFTQICFYLGLWKKSPQSTELMKVFLESNINDHLDDLNKTDLAIVSDAAYKTSAMTAIPSFLKRVVDEAIQLDVKNDDLLVTFIKSLRLNRVKSNELYEKLKSSIQADVEKFHFKGLTHIFAYFVEGLYNDDKVCKILIDECMQRLEEVGPGIRLNNDMRAKDLATFLWSCAHLSAQKHLNSDDLKFIEKMIAAKIERGEFKYSPDELVDACLSLWILGHKSEKITSEVFNINTNQTGNNAERIKLDSRFRLLMSCIEIENPEMLKRKIGKERSFNESRAAPEYLLRNNNALLQVFKLLQSESQDFSLKSVKLVSPIVELNIPGILAKFDDDKSCFIEVITDSQILQFNNVPTALVSLKARLLEHLGYNVISIKPTDMESEEKLRSLLTEKLNFLADAGVDDKSAETVAAV